MFTGTTEKMKLFIPANKYEVGLQASDEDGFIFFNTGGSNERMRVFNNTFSPSTPIGGGVAIHSNPTVPVGQPGALLHIGDRFSSFGAASSLTGLNGLFGWRKWMSIGTFNFASSDNMYIGLKDEANLNDPPEFPTVPNDPNSPLALGDRHDAVINWGDNLSATGGVPTGPDYLRFINTLGYNPSALPGNDTHFDGKEVARFAPNSYFGIGNFYNDPLFTTKDPVRRLEILSDKTTATDNGTPQFRITHTQQGTVNTTTLGKFTDFHTNNNGDLAILTNDNTQTNTANQSFKQRFVGINANTPLNTLEINSQYASPSTTNNQPQDPTVALPPTGWAGLRFTDLNSASIVQANPGTGVLSVDANGDVVYVHGGNGATLGNACSSPANNLPSNWEIPLNNFNWYYTGQGDGSNTNDVAIGYGCNKPLPARISVFESTANPTANNSIVGSFINEDIAQNTQQIIRGIDSKSIGIQNQDKVLNLAGDFYSANSNENIAVSGISEESSITEESIGGYFMSAGNNSAAPSNYGVFSSASGINNKSNVGIQSVAINSSNQNLAGQFIAGFVSPTATNIGVDANTIGSQKNIAGRFIADKNVLDPLPFANTNIGVYAIGGGNGLNGIINPANNPTNTDIGVFSYADNQNAPSSYAGYFQGNVMIDGEPFCTQQTTFTSDFNVKREIIVLDRNLALISKLNPVSFIFDNSYSRQLDFSEGKNYGFIAQEVANFIPELVKDVLVPETSDSSGNITNPAVTLKGLNYTGLIPFAIGGI